MIQLIFVPVGGLRAVDGAWVLSPVIVEVGIVLDSDVVDYLVSTGIVANRIFTKDAPTSACLRLPTERHVTCLVRQHDVVTWSNAHSR